MRIAAPLCLTACLCVNARSQTLVDCTGANTSAYKTISAALAATPVLGTNIQVTGPCSEDVNINGRYNLNLGAASGKTVVLSGTINIGESTNVYVYGFQVTNSGGNGIHVDNSRGVRLDTVTSNGNAGDGLALTTASSVTVYGPSSFQNNTNVGIDVLPFSGVDLETSGGGVNVSGNGADGISETDHAKLFVAGSITVENNGNGAGQQPSGIYLQVGSLADLLDCTGNNLIQANHHAGIELLNTPRFRYPHAGVDLPRRFRTIQRLAFRLR